MNIEQQRAIAIAKARLRAGNVSAPERPVEPTEDQKIRGSIPHSIAQGGLDPIHGLAQLAYKASPGFLQRTMTDVDKWLYEKTGGKMGATMPLPEALRSGEKSFEEAKKAVGREGFDFARLGGNVASPVTMTMMGASIPSKVLPAIGKGAAMGGAAASTMPVYEDDYWTGKVKQLGTGAVISGAIPGAIGAAKGTGAFVRNVFSPKADATNFLKGLAGDDIVLITNALKTAKPGETAQQVLGRVAREAKAQGDDIFGTKIARLESDLAKSATTDDLLNTIYAKQEVGRENLISAIAGTPEDMAKAKAARTMVTKPWYKATEKSKVDVDTSVVSSKIDEIIAKNQNQSSVVRPLNIIKKKLESGERTPQKLYSLSKEIKDMMDKTTPGGSKQYNVQALDDIKGLLDKQIGESEIAFKTAQSGYKQMSQPINRMEVGAELRDALVKATEKESPATFLSAMKEAPRTIKRATGFKRYDELGDILTPEQVGQTKDISEALLNQQFGKSLAGMKMSSLKDVDGELVLALPHILSRPVVIANAVLQRLGKKDITPEIHKFLNESMADPKLLLKALEEPTQSAAKKAAIEVLKSAQTAVTSGAAQSSGIGVAR